MFPMLYGLFSSALSCEGVQSTRVIAYVITVHVTCTCYLKIYICFLCIPFPFLTMMTNAFRSIFVFAVSAIFALFYYDSPGTEILLING